jgi:hypothetical protein
MVFFVSALSFFSRNYSRGSPCYGIIFDECTIVAILFVDFVFINIFFVVPDLTASGKASWMDKIQLTVQNVLQKFNFFKTPVDLSGTLYILVSDWPILHESCGNAATVVTSTFSEASRVRKEYDDASSKLSKIQSKISSLMEKLKQNFGRCQLKFCSLCEWCSSQLFIFSYNESL